jgi:hypothetical protein
MRSVAKGEEPSHRNTPEGALQEASQDGDLEIRLEVLAISRGRSV